MERTCSLPVENKGEIGGYKKRKNAMTWRRLEARRRKIEKLRDADPCETSNNSGVSTIYGLIGSCLTGYDKTGVTGKSMTLRQQLVKLLSRRSGSLRTECLEIQVSGVNNDTPRRSITSVTPSQVKEHNNPGISQGRPSIATNPREGSTTSASEKLCNGITDDANEEGKRNFEDSVGEHALCVCERGWAKWKKKWKGSFTGIERAKRCRLSAFVMEASSLRSSSSNTRGDVAHPLKHIVVNTSSTL